MRLLFGGPFEGLAVMVPGTLGFWVMDGEHKAEYASTIKFPTAQQFNITGLMNYLVE